MKNLWYFLAAPFSKKKIDEILRSSMNQLFRQRFIIFEKLRYRGELLLKLWVVEVATMFH